MLRDLSIVSLILVASTPVQAQTSSLYGPSEMRTPLTLAQHSWYFIPPEPVRQVKLNDIVTIVVKENSQVITEGEVQRRTQENIDLRLRNLLQLQHFSLTPLPSSVGEPRARGSLDGQVNNTAEVETQDSMTFRIAARVVDTRPNNHLVIEAHRSIRDNDQTFEKSLTGIIRPEDVAPDNTVMSEDILELQISKRETGLVRDAYRRGWLLQTLDRFKPF